jgi:hypothetical protein
MSPLNSTETFLGLSRKKETVLPLIVVATPYEEGRTLALLTVPLFFVTCTSILVEKSESK